MMKLSSHLVQKLVNPEQEGGAPREHALAQQPVHLLLEPAHAQPRVPDSADERAVELLAPLLLRPGDTVRGREGPLGSGREQAGVAPGTFGLGPARVRRVAHAAGADVGWLTWLLLLTSAGMFDLLKQGEYAKLVSKQIKPKKAAPKKGGDKKAAANNRRGGNDQLFSYRGKAASIYKS